MQSVYSTAPADSTNWILVGGVLHLLLKCSRFILQPQSTGPPGYSLGESYPFCRDAVGVFYSLSGLDQLDTRWWSLTPSAEMQSVHSAAPTDWATRALVGIFLHLLQRCSQCILQPQRTRPTGYSLGESYSFCWNAVGSLCNHNRLGHQDTRWDILTRSAVMQSVYSTTPAEWAIYSI